MDVRRRCSGRRCWWVWAALWYSSVPPARLRRALQQFEEYGQLWLAVKEAIQLDIRRVRCQPASVHSMIVFRR
jgi:hypothetical protein